jgi:hypothetical protein
MPRIKALIAKSEARRVGLESGAKAWESRATDYPAIWTPTGELRNKGTT